MLFFFCTFPLPPRSTLFPYTTLFRSCPDVQLQRGTTSSTFPGSLTCAPAPLTTPPTTSRPPSDAARIATGMVPRSEEHTSELQSLRHLVCRLLLEKKKNIKCNKTTCT